MDEKTQMRVVGLKDKMQLRQRKLEIVNFSRFSGQKSRTETLFFSS